MAYGTVYKVASKTSGKVFVGLTNRDLDERWATHCFLAHRGSTHALGYAIRKYGPDDFVVEELAQAENAKELKKLEMYWIGRLNAFPGGYNITEGGAMVSDDLSNWGRKPLSAEARAKIAAAHLGRKLSPETRSKISATLKGRKLSAAHCAKISEHRKGKKRGAAFSELMSRVHKGKTVSDETRAKIGAGNRGKKYSSAVRAKISAALTGKKRSPEVRAKMAAAQRKRWHGEGE